MNTEHDAPSAIKPCPSCDRPWFGVVAYCPYCGLEKGKAVRAVHAKRPGFGALVVEANGAAASQPEPPLQVPPAHDNTPPPKAPAWTQPLWEEPAWGEPAREERRPATGALNGFALKRAAWMTFAGCVALLLVGAATLRLAPSIADVPPVARTTLATAATPSPARAAPAARAAPVRAAAPHPAAVVPAQAATVAATPGRAEVPHAVKVEPAQAASVAAALAATAAPAPRTTAGPSSAPESLCSPASEADGLCKARQ